MTREEIEKIIMSEVMKRASLLGFPITDITPAIDLMRSGLYDSMAFVDLIVSLEEQTGTEIDMETVAPKDIATPQKLRDLINQHHG